MQIDPFILAKALAIAVETIDRLPREQRALSDQAAMREAFDELLSDTERTMILELVRWHLDILQMKKAAIAGGPSYSGLCPPPPWAV